MGPGCVGFMGEQEEFEVDMLWGGGQGAFNRALVIENFKTVCCTSLCNIKYKTTRRQTFRQAVMAPLQWRMPLVAL